MEPFSRRVTYGPSHQFRVHQYNITPPHTVQSRSYTPVTPIYLTPLNITPHTTHTATTRPPILYPYSTPHNRQLHASTSRPPKRHKFTPHPAPHHITPPIFCPYTTPHPSYTTNLVPFLAPLEGRFRHNIRRSVAASKQGVLRVLLSSLRSSG